MGTRPSAFGDLRGTRPGALGDNRGTPPFVASVRWQALVASDGKPLSGPMARPCRVRWHALVGSDDKPLSRPMARPCRGRGVFRRQDQPRVSPSNPSVGRAGLVSKPSPDEKSAIVSVTPRVSSSKRRQDDDDIAVVQISFKKRKNQVNPSCEEFVARNPGDQLELLSKQDYPDLRTPFRCNLCQVILPAVSENNAKRMIQHVATKQHSRNKEQVARGGRGFDFDRPGDRWRWTKFAFQLSTEVSRVVGRCP